jgi:hypothetical protein
MRKSITVICIAVLLICVWLLLYRKTENVKKTVTEEQPAITNQGVANQAVAARTATESSNIPKSPKALLPEEKAKFPTSLEGSNALQQEILRDWQRPIDFYGKVVDEGTNPVAGASVTFGWSEFPTEQGARKATTTSDAQGLFSLHDQRGPSLDVWVSKPEYTSSHNGQWGFIYAHGAVKYAPDSSNPVIFVLHKKGEGTQLITSQNGMKSDVWVHVPPNNTPVTVDLLKKQVSTSGQLLIDQFKPPFREATNWSFNLSIPDGGLVESDDGFQFEAPESNYQKTLEFNFNKGQTNWATQVTKQFYIVFGEPRKYGWLRIESNLAQETVFLTYAINPSGSRNLEPAN